MREILSAAQCKEADRRTIEGGTPSPVLMERAAEAVVKVIRKRDYVLSSVLVFCGTGNNGGDGVAVARLLSKQGASVTVVALGSADRYSEDRRAQEERLSRECPGVPVISMAVLGERPDAPSLLVDALFGIGLTRPLEGEYRQAVLYMNASTAPVVAVDLPSGIHTDTGAQLGLAVRAQGTVTFTADKAGLLLYPGRTCAGEVSVADIGIPIPEDMRKDPFALRVTTEDLSGLPRRDSAGNKGTFGKVLVIAGSSTICGAAVLAAKAVLRSGAGMVRILTHEDNRVPIAASFPEALITTYGSCEDIPAAMKECLAWADLVLIGPGIGTGESGSCLLETLLGAGTASRLPLVLAADALTLLSARDALCGALRGRSEAITVLTPHVLELHRLSRLPVDRIKEDLPQAASVLAADTGAIVVAKDASTAIASPGLPLYLYAGGTSALATAGSGDVLAGMIAGLLAQHRDRICGKKTAAELTALAVCIHGSCGEEAAKNASERSVIAGDLFRYFPCFLGAQDHMFE